MIATAGWVYCACSWLVLYLLSNFRVCLLVCSSQLTVHAQLHHHHGHRNGGKVNTFEQIECAGLLAFQSIQKSEAQLSLNKHETRKELQEARECQTKKQPGHIQVESDVVSSSLFSIAKCTHIGIHVSYR